MTRRATLTVVWDVDIDMLATMFAGLNDDEQARFFCKAAELLGEGREMQAHFIGKHLATCECSTHEGRELVRGIVESMEVAR